MAQASGAQGVAVAWAVQGGDGRVRVEWDVPDAARFEVYRVPGAPEAKREALRGGPVPVVQAATLEKVELPDLSELRAHQYVIAAFAGDGPWPAAVAPVGVGNPQDKADMAAALARWKKWRELSPYQADAKSKVGPEQVTHVQGVKRTKQTYTLTKNPDEAITFDPNVSMCFPGAIVQAKPAIENGYLIPAGIEDSDRADLGITVDRLTGRKETASPPSASNVTAAIGKVIGDDAPGSSDVVFRRVEAYDSAEVALELGISAKYGGFAASLDISGKRKETKNTVLVYLRERGFTAFCDVSTPAALFKDDFTEEKLNKLVGGGYMGPENPPLLVNSVIYGRMIVFTFTSISSETEINAALKASYSGFADVDAHVKAHYQEIISKSEVSIISKGITGEQVKELLTKGTLSDSFATPQKYKSYVRIGYTLQTLDGVPAKMSETTTYDAVTWGDGGLVTLQIKSMELDGKTVEEFGVTIDKEDLSVTKGNPATKSRSFAEDGSGDPFLITEFTVGGIHYGIAGVGSPGLRLSPKELDWFAGGRTIFSGHIGGMDFSFNYDAVKG
ncbi:thiol-activated cytolysin family protein [Streptomyces sp. G7(2002)]|uniref:thiol-activated cytolysin family protein n=1 Tax=Streptomyces sp. G7(2002) TaxID=2971798 RepID=UPI00237E28BC|nr:thiol-activated cytolysin family protein [Streptomyces sp. G7(2002)]WDT53562.1 thiol-activated cytolysin family protein [Streptomyces sp. G7(2002)]